MDAATGDITVAEELLRTTLANCPTWLDLTDSPDEATALTTIHVDALPTPAPNKDAHDAYDLAALRPYAILWTEEDGSGSVSELDNAYNFRTTGELWLYVSDNVQRTLKRDYAELGRKVKNYLGGLKADLREMAGIAGRMTLDRIATFGPYRTTPEEHEDIGDAWYFLLQCEWSGVP